MSDAKPFAEVDRGDEDECENPTITIGGFVEFSMCDEDSHTEAVERFERYARQINAAVARERREAAAEALEEAGDFALSAHYGPPIRMIGSLDDGTENRRLLRDWLRTRAAALRKGDG